MSRDSTNESAARPTATIIIVSHGAIYCYTR